MADSLSLLRLNINFIPGVNAFAGRRLQFDFLDGRVYIIQIGRLMYCPKCGIQNAETNKYCRACRENLKVVSQAMKQRLPVVIASRLDQMLDSRSERFRRDSILSFLMWLVFFAAGLSGNMLWLYLSPPLFLLGIWEYLAYRRSLAPDFDWGTLSEEATSEERFDKSGVVTLGIVGSRTDVNARTTDRKNSQSS